MKQQCSAYCKPNIALDLYKNLMCHFIFVILASKKSFRNISSLRLVSLGVRVSPNHFRGHFFVPILCYYSLAQDRSEQHEAFENEQRGEGQNSMQN